ncbi:MAG TPA: ATP-binding protein, partial [Bacteroidia bacterium]|nr:ATP-binding protein [Bacteroidia bacterium]
ISSHDLQEPLRKIQSFGDRLKTGERDQLSEQGKDYLDRILNAASRMQNLINDLLAFSRVSTRVQEFSSINLNTLLKEVLSDMEVSIERAGAEVVSELLPTIPGEPTLIRQLFQNLISNAVKFRKPDIAPRIRIYSKTVTGSNPHVDLYFEDNGIGFDEKYLDKIFNIFQRLEGQKYEGSGIGLAICKKIALKHGGTITAKSEPGKGALFIVSLATPNTTPGPSH